MNYEIDLTCSYFPTRIAVERTNLQKYSNFHGKRFGTAKNEKINSHLHEFNKTSDIPAKGYINAGFWEQAMASSRINSNKVVCAVITVLKFLSRARLGTETKSNDFVNR
ncbi:hypothetical protein ACT8ZS_22000 [Paenibacillus sp. M.A.Huq-84]